MKTYTLGAGQFIEFIESIRAPNVWVFIAQLVEHCSANAEAMSSHPVKAPRTFFGLTLRLLKVHLTSKFFRSQINKHVFWKNSSKKKFGFGWILDFLWIFEVVQIFFQVRGKRGLGQVKAVTSIQERLKSASYLLRGFVRSLWKLSGTNRFYEVELTQNSKMSSLHQKKK